MKQIYPLIQSEYHREFPEAGEFPPEPCLEWAKIGRDIEGKLEETAIHLIYDQDEYVAVHLDGETVTLIDFYR